ncbi:MAG TPA: hypothetical protein VFV31_06890 [Chitinophagaceae bacterium]|nr:hypothetical protein [Chitinophagaceae bacterium]
MKKMILSLSFMLSLAAVTSFAAPDPEINEKVLEAFSKEFAGAELVEWKEVGSHYKATFVLNGYRTEAYFSEKGELEGSARSLFFNQLPLVVMTAVDKRFANAGILDVTEMNSSSGTYYRISLETVKNKYRIRVYADGTIVDTERLKS